MIGSFWNLCRACPSMPIDKLHSEYRSTYRWHEYTGGSRPEVVRRPPAPNQFAPVNEPQLPRRKKCPELAYRTNEFMSCDAPDGKNAIITRARPGERCQIPSRRSKSEGPPESVANGRASTMREIVDGNQLSVKKTGESSGLFKKTISKLSTEYRLQFVWPNVHRVIRGQTDDTVEPPRKSISMGAIKQPAQSIPITTVHKKRTTEKKEAAAFELEPLVTKLDESLHNNIDKTMYRKRNFDATDNNQRHSEREKYGFSADTAKVVTKNDNNNAANKYGIHGDSWFKEVLELRKKAGEYKCRGWGIEIDPELYKKQEKLWEQVSRRSSLSALSLASTVRPFTKEEKDKENTKKSSPTKAPSHKVSGQVYPTFDNNALRREAVRHHLERTTGPDVEEGTLLPSPTRDKLMPTIPKSREDEHFPRGSPKKSITSRHESPQKSSPQKGSPKKIPKSGHKGRSQSVGPTVADSGSSPKRQSRSTSSSTAPATAATVKTFKKGTEERRPRPTTLSTTPKSFRSKSGSLHANRALSAPTSHLPHPSLIGDDVPSKSDTLAPHLRKSVKTANNHQLRPKSSVINGDPMADSMIRFNRRNKKSAETDDDAGEDRRGASPPLLENTEYIVKSPPEPTRVKSPEQILMRSPDPVNWTVPLDTGKTFTVTQNVRDGEAVMRPHSDFKASTPVDKPPPAPLSAPPELAEQLRLEASKEASAGQTRPAQKTPDPMTMSTISAAPDPPAAEVRYDKPVPGSTLRRLEDPAFDSESKSRSGVPSTESFEKAHDRFDRFWGGEKA